MILIYENFHEIKKITIQKKKKTEIEWKKQEISMNLKTATIKEETPKNHTIYWVETEKTGKTKETPKSVGSHQNGKQNTKMSLVTAPLLLLLPTTSMSMLLQTVVRKRKGKKKIDGMEEV